MAILNLPFSILIPIAEKSTGLNSRWPMTSDGFRA